jgi:hypothetical protein
MLGMTKNVVMDFGMLGFVYNNGYHSLNVNATTAFWAMNGTMDNSVLIAPIIDQ